MSLSERRRRIASLGRWFRGSRRIRLREAFLAASRLSAHLDEQRTRGQGFRDLNPVTIPQQQRSGPDQALSLSTGAGATVERGKRVSECAGSP